MSQIVRREFHIARSLAARALASLSLVVAGMVSCQEVLAAEPDKPAPILVRVCESPVSMDVTIAASGGAAPTHWTWSNACGLDAAMLNLDRGVGAVDPKAPRASVLVANGRADIEIEFPATPGRHYRGKQIPIGAPAVALEGGPGATVRIMPLPRRRLMIHAKDVEPAALAREIARVAAVRVDGIDRLAHAPVSFSFGAVEIHDALGILGDVSEFLVLRDGRAHFAFSTRQRYREFRALDEAIDTAMNGDDEAAREAAVLRMIAFVKQPAKGPVIGATKYWTQAASFAEDRGDRAEAERLLRERIAHIERVEGGPVGEDYGRALGVLAELRLESGDVAGAVELLERGLAIAEAELGPVDPGLARMLWMLGSQRLAAKRDAEAEQLFKRSIECFGEPDEDHVLALVVVLDALTAMYRDQDRLAEAQPLVERDVAVTRKAFGEDAYVTTIARLQLAELLYSRDLLPRAAEVLERALAVRGDGAVSESQVARAREKVDAIRALGPYAADGMPGEGAIATLRTNLERGVSEEMVREMMSILEKRAARQYRESPASGVWRATCAGFAEVGVMSFKADRREAIRPSLLGVCFRNARGE